MASDAQPHLHGGAAVMYTGEGDDDVTCNVFIKSSVSAGRSSPPITTLPELELSSATCPQKGGRYKVVYHPYAWRVHDAPSSRHRAGMTCERGIPQ
jgi:hypothetical protein